MKQPAFHNILVMVMSSCMAIGLYRQEVRIDVQEKRIQMLEDALLLEKKNQGAERPSRSLQENCECPFTKKEDGDWVTTDADSLFIFEKGIIIGKKNLGGFYRPACNYGNHILSVDVDGSNCPSGDGSVTFGTYNTASGTSSAVVGGRSNEASGWTSGISGGLSNTVSAESGSISGGSANAVHGDFGSILGGQWHVLEARAGTVSSKSNFKNATNATVIETIPAHHPEDRIAALEEHSPFNCTAEEGWCTSENKRFLFSEGVVVGAKNPSCHYGNSFLSVDAIGSNCPSGDGSVTFGTWNTASGTSSAVVGGLGNEASGTASSISGGQSNAVSAYTGSISGGTRNEATGVGSSVSGGQDNTVSEIAGVVTGPFTKNEDNDWVTTDTESLFIFEKGIIIGKKNTGYYDFYGNYVPACNYGNGVLSVDADGDNCPSGNGLVTFGDENTASGERSAVVGGHATEASGDYSSISGGKHNVASEDYSSISGGEANTVSARSGSISGGFFNTVQGTADYSSISGGGYNAVSGHFGSISGGMWNTVQGNFSAVVGGRYNEASGDYSSISGGESNTVSALAGSISGGMWNTVHGNYGSILGGRSHILGAGSGTVSSKSNFQNATNATVIDTIPAHHPEDRIAALEEHSPFDCTAEEGWCTSEHKRFLFSEGIVVGVKNPECKYGTGTLSVDFMGTNCPAHRGSVTFGKKNQMSRAGSFTVG